MTLDAMRYRPISDVFAFRKNAATTKRRLSCDENLYRRHKNQSSRSSGQLREEQDHRASRLVGYSCCRSSRVTRAALSALVNERADLSPEMAIRIEKAFGVAMETLMRMQNSFDIAEAREKATAINVAPYKRKSVQQIAPL